MGLLNTRKKVLEREKDIQAAMRDIRSGAEGTIRSAALAYGIPYSTLRGRMTGAQTRAEAHIGAQVLTPMEEKAVVRFCERLDDLGHPITMPLLKQYASSLLPPSSGQEVGKHWISRFLKRQHGLTSKYSQRLDRQRANADDPEIMRDHFRKVNNTPWIFDFRKLTLSVAGKPDQEVQCPSQEHIQHG